MVSSGSMLSAICPMCKVQRNRFACTECLNGILLDQRTMLGDTSKMCSPQTEPEFSTSQQLPDKHILLRSPVRYRKMQRNSFLALTLKRKKLLQSLEKYRSPVEQMVKFQVCKEDLVLTNQIVQSELTFRTTKLSKVHEEVEVLRSENEQLEKRCTDFSRKIEIGRERLSSAQQRYTRKERELQKRLGDLVQMRRLFCNQLLDTIYSISLMPNASSDPTLQPQIETRADDSNEPTAPMELLLEEAMQPCLSELEGRPIPLDYDPSRRHYRIVGSYLPVNGDYSFVNFASELSATDRASGVVGHVDRVTVESPVEEQVAGWRVANTKASLALLTQFTHQLAHVLDVRLPKRLCYSSFFADQLRENLFNAAVARLNQNVLYLTYAQQAGLGMSQSSHTVTNLLAAVNSPSLGCVSAFTVDWEQMELFGFHDSLELDSLASWLHPHGSAGATAGGAEELELETTAWETVNDIPPEWSESVYRSAASQHEPAASSSGWFGVGGFFTSFSSRFTSGAGGRKS